MAWRADLGSTGCRRLPDERGEQGSQKGGQPAEQQGEVVSGGGEDRVGAVAVASLEVVAAHAVLGLDVADDGLDGGAALHLAADGAGRECIPAGHRVRGTVQRRSGPGHIREGGRP